MIIDERKPTQIWISSALLIFFAFIVALLADVLLGSRSPGIWVSLELWYLH